jgi:hypothetical protein
VYRYSYTLTSAGRFPENHLFAVEVISKPQIAFESKAQADEQAQHTFKYVSILRRSATQLSDAGWGFETTSNQRSNTQYPARCLKPSLHKIDDRLCAQEVGLADKLYFRINAWKLGRCMPTFSAALVTLPPHALSALIRNAFSISP